MFFCCCCQYRVFFSLQIRPYYYVLYYTHWMIYFVLCFLLSLQGINGILADEMGLGKTVQSIALLAHLAEVRESTSPPHAYKKLSGIFNCLFDLWKHLTFSLFVHLHPFKESLVSGCAFCRCWNISLNDLFHCCEQLICQLFRLSGLLTPKGEKVEFRGNECFSVLNYGWQEDTYRVPLRLPVIGCSHRHIQRPPAVAADDVFSPLFLHRETTSGVRSWSSLLHPHSTTGTRSSPALFPNSRWESTPAETPAKACLQESWHPHFYCSF